MVLFSGLTDHDESPGVTKGLRTAGGAAGVGRSTTSSVVITYCFILLTNFFLTMGLNIIHDLIYKF